MANVVLTAREGRHKQRYTSNGSRIIVGCVPMRYNNDNNTVEVLLINSRKHSNQWILPKGGWEDDESVEEAAMRETMEEAGVVGQIRGCVAECTVLKKKKNQEQVMAFFRLDVTEVMDSFPEMHERGRRWFSADDAILNLADRFMMVEAVRKATASQYIKPVLIRS